MGGWTWFSKSFGGGGRGRIREDLGVHERVCVCVNLGSRPSICPHLYPALHVKAFWAHHAKSPRVWKWKRKCDYESISIVNTHTHTLLHTCSFTQSRLMSAAQLLRLPKQQQRRWYLAHHHMGVSTVTDGGALHPGPRTDSSLLPAQAARTGRQADRQAGSVIHANILKYMAGKLPPSRGQIGWTCRFNRSKLWKSAAECSFIQLHWPFSVRINWKRSKSIHLTWSVKYLGLIYPNVCALKNWIHEWPNCV